MRIQAGDILYTNDTLVLGLVGQHGRAGDVADGVNAGFGRAAVAVDDNAAPIGLHFGSF